ncbi:hypothetical protein Mia14_0998 [Candidatus Mancarchaeum acidiphilum]|uniref:Uncharacterized protein n=1 Tax=Candidatus Mancarchaeum acidiphilum TaxID=1920749 RepID=A0A218NPA5_9ARCH|nr:hypothetical protein [Candidatus Mancarchaeum acidiphilum]ASI14266.1 hypothetical protein Mia14_0998 [Candidatus Mancarchaeum acidiphilum]
MAEADESIKKNVNFLLEKKNKEYSMDSLKDPKQLKVNDLATSASMAELLNLFVESKKLSEALLENCMVDETYLATVEINAESIKLKSMTKG